jgi:hypothetical protein
VDIEDYLDTKNPAAKEQIRGSFVEYLLDQAHDANEFLADLKQQLRNRSEE